ncbi:hypothetical protein PR048_003743 [Dryococelus australis]|uniref:PiggyBac transposable element-derived protein domain-containing protein n=1 Tax=Dryococelus australis TaxID=614101 RepID=A0ABQ9INW3_9NEOP|nr:hypothetical protein PR048_003743 [Dryococelus australis]
MHYKKDANEDTGKPEDIHFYNETKWGVDSFDQLVHNYSVSWKTQIWALWFFYGILDQTGINVMVLLQTARDQDNVVRRKYLWELGRRLAEPHMKTRALSKNLPRELIATIRKMANIQEEEKEEDDNPPSVKQKQGICSVCPRSKDRKTKSACVKCHKMVCAEHKRDVCLDCV